jgi:hypothetical protein
MADACTVALRVRPSGCSMPRNGTRTTPPTLGERLIKKAQASYIACSMQYSAAQRRTLTEGDAWQVEFHVAMW